MELHITLCFSYVNHYLYFNLEETTCRSPHHCCHVSNKHKLKCNPSYLYVDRKHGRQYKSASTHIKITDCALFL